MELRRYLQMIVALAEEAVRNKKDKSEEYKKQYRALAGSISHLSAQWQKGHLPRHGDHEQFLFAAFGGETAEEIYASALDATCVLALAASDEPFGKLLDVGARAASIAESIAEAAREMLRTNTEVASAEVSLALPKLVEKRAPHLVLYQGGKTV